MALDVAIAIAQLIDGQVKFIWAAIGVIAVAQIAILRAALNAANTRRSAEIWAGVCAVFVATSYMSGYAAASGLVTLVTEVGTAAAACTIKDTLYTIELFVGGQALALIAAAAAMAISFLKNRDLLKEMIDGGKNDDS